MRALAAHPGFAGTHLAANGQYGRTSGGVATIVDRAIRVVSQSAAAGAWPSLMAATADLPSGTYVGPRGLLEFAGRPKVTAGTRLARDPAAARDAVGAQRAHHRPRLSLTCGPAGEFHRCSGETPAPV